MTMSHQTSESPVSARPAELPAGPLEPTKFQRQLTIATLGLLFVVLLIYILERCESILQPLLIALFACYVIVPIHLWLVRRGLPPKVAYVTILGLTLVLILGLGEMVYSNLHELNSGQLQEYERRLEAIVQKCYGVLGVRSTKPEGFRLRDLFFTESGLNVRVRAALLSLTGTFLGFLTVAFVVFIYLIFLLAEKERVSTRLALAFGPTRAEQTLSVMQSINEAISQYISVKAFVSFLQAILSVIVFLVFGVDFAVMWGVLIFLFNFIPYIGSIIAVGLPVLLSLLKYANEPWKAAVVLLLLLVIQRVVDNWIEPRLTGQKLGLSPLLVLLALAFWGWLWGIVGLVLAVPLTVAVKIILGNIKETRPIAALMSNV
jgi:predicted PurR-regulated permease PerM